MVNMDHSKDIDTEGSMDAFMMDDVPTRRKSTGNRSGTKRGAVDKNSDEYKKRRERNNLAVKKSRSKTKEKMVQTMERVNKLRAENEMLEAKVQLLTKELSFLKDLFLAHAGGSNGQNLKDVDLSVFNEDAMEENNSANSFVKVKKEKDDDCGGEMYDEDDDEEDDDDTDRDD